MGYEGKKVLKLNFTDPQYEGLEVVVRKPIMEQVLSVADGQEGVGEDADKMETLRPLAELLCSLLVGWNLENDGEPVPHTAEALLAQDFDVAQAIIKAWEDNAMGVSVPLEKASSDGERSLVASIPMETLSPSLAS